jgi:hypothetical protein
MAERIVADKGKPGLRRRRPSVAVVGQDKAGDNRQGADGFGEPPVGIGHRGRKVLGLCCANSVLHKQRQQRFGRCPVRLSEVDVKGDDGCTGFAQPIDELGDDAARPGPLAELVEALVVDIDDADRRVPRLARGCLLVRSKQNSESRSS